MAERLDKERLRDGRFFQVSPGSHVLLVHFDYEVGGGSGMSLMGGKRSMNPTYRKVRPSFNVAFPVNSSTATALHNLPPTAHGAAAPVRGAATYRAPGR